MKDYSHIEKYERILNEGEAVLIDLRNILERISLHEAGYRELMDWYGSDGYREDLRDDEAGLIPDGIRRGVLSEDGIWNHSVEHRAVAIRMMEVALEMMKSR